MAVGRRRVSEEAQAQYRSDTELAARFGELFDAAGDAEGRLREAQANRASLEEQHELGKAFDAALTAAMRSAYAAQRVEAGTRGYDDWIYRRKAKAKPKVRAWTAEAERLLTLRETYRLNELSPLVVRRPAVSPGRPPGSRQPAA
jgi:hypothetical protein